jgi:hypothetical protein
LENKTFNSIRRIPILKTSVIASKTINIWIFILFNNFICKIMNWTQQHISDDAIFVLRFQVRITLSQDHWSTHYQHQPNNQEIELPHFHPLPFIIKLELYFSLFRIWKRPEYFWFFWQKMSFTYW